MNRGLLSATAVLGVLLISLAIADSGSISFRVDIKTDTTLSIPELCETDNGSVIGVLEFNPGITTLDDPEAVAIDSCLLPWDWSMTNEGNVVYNISFELSSDMPNGVIAALSNVDSVNGSPYSGTNYINLSSTPQTPLWSQYLSKTETLPIFQRVAADATAEGDTSSERNITITSMKSI